MNSNRKEMIGEQHKPMNPAALIFIGVIGIFLLLCLIENFAGTTKIYDQATVTRIEQHRSKYTGRLENHLYFDLPGHYTGPFGIVDRDIVRHTRVEITDSAAEKLEPGQKYTISDIEKFQGRSIAGRMWDFVKKPR